MLIVTTPSLLAAHLLYRSDNEDELVGVLAVREGVDPAVDLRPRIAAAVFSGLISVAYKYWMAGGDRSAAAMVAAYEACAALSGSALSGHWT
jgi:hypothetical protein